ncbi:hypothetical protein FJ365_00470 [Candidatus Dependentiae bacterium]|nr:hypothetical protein [Candidatus Dependentiae bacterium]
MYKHIFLVALLFSAEVDLRASEAISSEALICEEAKAALEAELAANEGALQCRMIDGFSALPDDIEQKLRILQEIYPDDKSGELMRATWCWAKCIVDSLKALPREGRIYGILEYNDDQRAKLAAAISIAKKRLKPIMDMHCDELIGLLYGENYSLMGGQARFWLNTLTDYLGMCQILQQVSDNDDDLENYLETNNCCVSLQMSHDGGLRLPDDIIFKAIMINKRYSLSMAEAIMKPWLDFIYPLISEVRILYKQHISGEEIDSYEILTHRYRLDTIKKALAPIMRYNNGVLRRLLGSSFLKEEDGYSLFEDIFNLLENSVNSRWGALIARAKN